MREQAPLLLTDEQMKEFITNGVLKLQTDFSKKFHEGLLAQLNQVYVEEGNPGNNILPRIRDLQKVFDHPVITGALTSVLGRHYLMHTHRHGHFNVIPTPGGWHKDSYWGYGRMRNHHSWWAMIMYFPQDTPIELGPTAVMPGSQYDETRTFTDTESPDAITSHGEAGTFVLIHYDIWHRATANMVGTPRYMLKFEFMRTEVPQAPSWDHQQPGWSLPAQGLSPYAYPTLWEENWNWLSGCVGSLADSKADDPALVADGSKRLADANEPVALEAAYELAARGELGRAALATALRSDELQISRVAAYGLSVAGEEVVASLADALADEREHVVRHAAFALGELGNLASAAVPQLVALTQAASAKVRITAIESLGMIFTPSEEIVAGLIQGLQDEDVQVRFAAALSLLRHGSAAEAAIPYLAEALDDENRYVSGHAMEALRYIDTDEARDILFKELFNMRWCSQTTKASTF